MNPNQSSSVNTPAFEEDTEIDLSLCSINQDTLQAVSDEIDLSTLNLQVQ